MGRQPRYDAQEALTQREHDVLELLRIGLTDAEIAERLGITKSVVSKHVSEIIGKLGVRNRYEAASWPERPPWWAGALAPVAFVWRKGGAALPAKASSLALVASGGALAAALGGLGLFAVLVVRAGAGANETELAQATWPRLSAGPWVFASGLPDATPLVPPLSSPNTPEPSPTAPASPTPAEDDEPATVTPEPPPLSPPPTAYDVPTPVPTLYDTPHASCEFFAEPKGAIFVTFAAEVPRERAEEIVTSLGATVSDYPEQYMGPLALPIPPPSVYGYVLMVDVPVGEEEAYVAQFVSMPEVVYAQADWPLCDAFR